MNYRRKEYNDAIERFGKAPTTLDELGQFCIVNINHALNNDKLGNRVVGFKWEVRYDEMVSNSHNCPIDGVTNWRGKDGEPLGYPGFQGRLWIRYATENTWFGSDPIDISFTHTGTGGYGGYSGPFGQISSVAWTNNKTFPYAKLAVYSWDYRFFLQDFPELHDRVSNEIAWALLQDKPTDIRHVFEWYCPETLAADAEYIKQCQELVGG